MVSSYVSRQLYPVVGLEPRAITNSWSTLVVILRVLGRRGDITRVQLVTKKARLEEFLIQAITRGSNDLGKVHIQVEYKGAIYYGFSASTDIITASVEAYIDALSRII